MTQYDGNAWSAIQALFDDEQRRATLVERVDHVLDLLDAGGTDRLARRMQDPPVWVVPVHASGEDWAIIWGPTEGGEPYVAYAGPSPLQTQR